MGTSLSARSLRQTSIPESFGSIRSTMSTSKPPRRLKARIPSTTSPAAPAPWTRAHKFWPSVGRVDNAYGDRNLMCSCPPVEAFAEAEQETAPR